MEPDDESYGVTTSLGESSFSPKRKRPGTCKKEDGQNGGKTCRQENDLFLMFIAVASDLRVATSGQRDSVTDANRTCCDYRWRLPKGRNTSVVDSVYS